ncbi:hypothetical protein ACFVYJ_03750 [Pontibacter sp. JAM-7]|uniref:hypothetical protein n=1 Tax=Pontibacter sp. JAM-7 TaxID=3366581 RepID=UPI003AF719F0
MPSHCYKFLLSLLPLLLTGCQLHTLVPATGSERTCSMNNSELQMLQQSEFSLFHQPKQKAALLKQARSDKNIALQAVLLSQPDAALEQLQQAVRLYERLVLYPSKDCPGDTYLNLRQRQAESMQQLILERQTLQQQHQEMQAKINALTELENELTRERESQP